MRASLSKAEIESEIVNRFGTAFKLLEKPPAVFLSTGIMEVDCITGGFPRGAITEIFGPASSGRTSFVLSALVHATRHEEVCALIDTHDTFDPTTAYKAGVNLDQLFWIRCGAKMELAFKASDLLLQGGGFGFVVLDIGNVPSQDAKRIISSWWYRFRRTVENTPTVFLVIAEDAAARSCASLTLKMNRVSDAWASIGRGSSTSTTQDPTHAYLINTFDINIERQRPIHVGERATQFSASAQ